MKTTKNLRLCVVAGLLAAAAPLSQALDLKPDAVAVQAGGGTHGTRMAGVGIVWDWDFERLRRAELTAQTELMLNGWRADAPGGGEKTYHQIVLLPSLRMRFDRGASPWFAELGIGASWMDRLFATPDKQFSTRWNFYDMMGVGYTLGGPTGHHELGLRWVHVSNGGVKKPNPGQDFIQLRYVNRF
jgi:lipid A 3-O-deacylase